MGTWTAFYVNTTKTEEFTEKLKYLSLIEDLTTGGFPEDFHQQQLFDEEADPNYLVFGHTQEDWITVVHNSFSKLEDWAEYFSRELDGKVIVTLAQNTSDVYYFALYDKGQKRREIEVCYGDDFDEVNIGAPFEFESEQPGKRREIDGEVYYIFDFDSIEEYARHFGLEIQWDYHNFEWKILKGAQTQETVSDFVSRMLEKRNKAWWKFW